MWTRNWLQGPCYERRAVLGLVLTPLLVGAARADDAATMPPLPGDRFVFLTGPKTGQVVKIDDLVLGGPQVQAYPISQDGTVRNESRLNLVILARFDPAELTEETRARAAEGVVAYSGICTHQGCPVNMWSKDRDGFVCSCHGSCVNPRNGAEVMAGPAPLPLAPLGLKVVDGAVAATSTFFGRIRFMPN